MKERVEAVDKELFDRVWKFFVEIGKQEQHFNNLQTRYRNMSSVWLLATFGAIGFVVSKKLSISIDTKLLIAGISTAGCIGILLLWVIDLLVYHRLLDSCFVEGLILEKKYTWLPQIRSNMMKTQKGQGVLFRVVVFYLGPATLLVIVSGGALSLWLIQQHWLAPIICFSLSIALATRLGYIIRSKTENTKKIFEKRLAEAQKE
jgi:hypothetical protein